ncbi:MAG: hypothetical protein ACRC6B_12380 [Fusobacteriaceae bacterium]
MNYTIDLENRRVILDATTFDLEPTVINEFDKLEKFFLPNTEDTYECELVLQEVDIYDDEQNVVGKETKAFARRVGNELWLMEFETDKYNKI